MLLAFEGVSKHIRAGAGGCVASVRALDAVSFSIAAGERVLLQGPPGAGKTTLLRCAADVLQPDGGTVRWSDDARPDCRYLVSDGCTRAAREPRAWIEERLTSHRGWPWHADALVDAVLACGGVHQRAMAARRLTPVEQLRARVAIALTRDPPLRLVLIDASPAAWEAIVPLVPMLSPARGPRLAVVVVGAPEARWCSTFTRLLRLEQGRLVADVRLGTRASLVPATRRHRRVDPRLAAL